MYCDVLWCTAIYRDVPPSQAFTISSIQLVFWYAYIEVVPKVCERDHTTCMDVQLGEWDMRLFDEGLSCGAVENQLVKHVHYLKHQFIVFLLGWVWCVGRV